MTDIDLAGPRAAAEGATPGTWVQNQPPRQAKVRTLGIGSDLDDEIAVTLEAHDAAYIAAANPAVVLDLLDRLAAAEGALRWITSDAPHDGSDDAEDAMHDRAMAALALVVGGNLQGPQIKTEETR